PVAGTPFDFRELHAIGDRIEETDQQLRNCGGYDTNFVLRPPATPDELRPAALLYEPSSGRTVRILTTEPGIQLYTGNFLSDNDMAKNGKSLGCRGALALETQHFPDSPNHPEFPSTLLRPGERFHSCTRWEFTTRESNA
ncbi:MAG: galactose-1-epimerase, partial [Victivallales bacterium]|nr:galactose-1-epimerase [Victivallales bacterium]